MSYLELLRLTAPEGTLLVSALAILAVGLTSPGRSGLIALLAAAGVALALGAVWTLPAQATLLGGMLVVSPLSSLLKMVCLVLALGAILLGAPGRQHAEFVGLTLLATIGLLLLVGSEELLMIFIGLELTGLSLYVLTAWDRERAASAEAGLKYFLFGSTASAFTLFGLSLVYGMCGSTSLAGISSSLAAQTLSPLLAAGLVMTTVGFAFKIAAAPFHLWAPDAYEAAPVAGAAFIASASKVAAFAVLGKLLLAGFAPMRGSADWQAFAAGWAPLLAVLAAFSILLGSLVALAQKNLRRLLAYSAVAHAGYTLIGLVAGGREGFRGHAFLHHELRAYLAGSVWRGGDRAARDRRRRLRAIRRLAHALPAARGLPRDLVALVSRAPATGRFFREVLSFRGRTARRGKSRPALAGGGSAAGKPGLALLLPDGLEGHPGRPRAAGGATRSGESRASHLAGYPGGLDGVPGRLPGAVAARAFTGAAVAVPCMVQLR